MTRFIPANSDQEISIVAQLAKTIWTEYFTPMIGEAQVAYMLEKMQSFDPMKQQISEGYRYYLIQEGTIPIGYICVKPEDSTLFLSKLYLLRETRGKGVGKQALNFIENLAIKLNKVKIWLTVNKGNQDTIEAYKKWGFKIVDTPVADIGGGFVMDDYKMEKSV